MRIELFVEEHDGIPRGPPAARPLSVHRLYGSFELKPPGATVTRCLGEMAFRLFDQGLRPLPGILFRERNVPAVRPSARRSAGFAVEHQSQQALNLRLPGHELQKHPRQPNRLLGQVPPMLVNTRHVIPAKSERRINRF